MYTVFSATFPFSSIDLSCCTLIFSLFIFSRTTTVYGIAGVRTPRRVSYKVSYREKRPIFRPKSRRFFFSRVAVGRVLVSKMKNRRNPRALQDATTVRRCRCGGKVLGRTKRLTSRCRADLSMSV